MLEVLLEKVVGLRTKCSIALRDLYFSKAETHSPLITPARFFVYDEEDLYLQRSDEAHSAVT